MDSKKTSNSASTGADASSNKSSHLISKDTSIPVYFWVHHGIITTKIYTQDCHTVKDLIQKIFNTPGTVNRLGIRTTSAPMALHLTPDSSAIRSDMSIAALLKLPGYSGNSGRNPLYLREWSV